MQFEEEQRLGNLGFHIFYVLSSLPAFFVIAKALNEASSDEAYYEAMYALIGIAAIFIGLYFLLFRTSAKTRIDSVGIHYRYWPIVFRWKTITWSETTSVTVKSFSALSDFGGWGYKIGRKKTGLILGGEQAIFIEKSSGKTFAISTLRAEAAKAAIAYWRPKNKELDG